MKRGRKAAGLELLSSQDGWAITLCQFFLILKHRANQMKHFTKTLLAGAIALAATGAAEARIADTAQPVTFMGSEMVLSVWNVTAQKSYTLDLGVTQSQFLAGNFAGLNRAVADVNLTSLLQASAATDDIRYSVTSGSSSTSSSNVLVASGDYAGLSKKVASLTNYGLIVSGQQGALADFTAVTSTSAKVNTAIISEANNASNVNSATGQAAASDAVNVSLFAANGDQGQHARACARFATERSDGFRHHLQESRHVVLVFSSARVTRDPRFPAHAQLARSAESQTRLSLRLHDAHGHRAY